MRDIIDSLDGGLDRLSRYVRRRVESAEDAEDVMQETLLALCRSWNAGQIIEDLLAWLFRTAQHKIGDWHRRRTRRASVTRLQELVDPHGVGPAAALEQQELGRAILDAIEELPEKQREVFVMTELQGLSFKQVQRRTGAPINTLLSRKRYAVLRLRKKLAARFTREGRDVE